MIEAQNIGKSVPEGLERNNYDLNVQEILAPPSSWRQVTNEPEHFVQFYETDTFLLDSLSGFMRTGLCDGDACIVVATKAHRDELDERLQAGGLDINAALSSCQYVSLDADETLSKFMIDGQPEPGRFLDTVGGIIARAAEGRQRVRIFGEMVALLWAEENFSAAIRLEEMWNDLQKSRPFSLFCAYPMKGFGGEAHAGGLTDVCTTHSRVIPAESYTALESADDRLRTIIQLQQKARTLEAEIAERLHSHTFYLTPYENHESEVVVRSATGVLILKGIPGSLR